jgi:hypothetical protein
MNFKLNTGAGDHFSGVAEKAKVIAKEKGIIVEFEFNEIICLVNADTVLDWLYRDYSNAFTMEWKSVGPNCLSEYDDDTKKELNDRQVKAELKEEKRREELAAADKIESAALAEKVFGIQLEIIPGKEEEFTQYVEKNSQDGYSRGVIDYAEGWAKQMQKEMRETGRTVSEVAESSQKGLGFLGITGFMYGCAVSALAHFWVHGEDLRKWHNKEYGVKEDKGGVVNPAIFTIG